MNQVKELKSDMLRVICADEQILKSVIIGDEEISRLLQIKVNPGWTVYGTQVFKYVLDKLKEDATHPQWWAYLIVLASESALVGNCGYKGRPDENGGVEIGYSVSPNYRNRGIATEAARLLVENAFSYREVNFVQAHTLAEENASTRVLSKCGFQKTGILKDEEDGLLWKWKIEKQ